MNAGRNKNKLLSENLKTTKMKQLKIFVMFQSLAILVACTAGKKSGQVQSNSEAPSAKNPSTTMSPGMEAGKVAYEKHCQTCHALKRPSSYSENQWRNLVPKMSAMANKKAGSNVVTEQEKAFILDYVLAMSTKK